MKKFTKKQLDALPFYSIKGAHYVSREALEALMDELEATEKEAPKADATEPTTWTAATR